MHTNKQATIYELFEQQSFKTPSHLAIATDNKETSYSELMNLIDNLSASLLNEGVHKGDVIGVYSYGCVELVISILAILRIGAIYLPLDKSYPIDRLVYMIEHSECKCVINTTDNIPFKINAIILDFYSKYANPHQFEIKSLNYDIYAPAFLIYTSGSTGKPKGVLISHDSLINRLKWMWEKFPYKDNEVCVLKTAICFVDSLAEIFSPLLQGVSLAIPDHNIIKDPNNFVDFLSKYCVTRVVLVPAYLSVLTQYTDLQQRIPLLYFWVVSGEILSLQLSKQFKYLMPEAKLINLYGSTEVTADVTYHEVSEIDFSKGTIPIGKPIDNNQVYIMDKNLNLLPKLQEGEIVVTGKGLALGYFKDETNNKFITIKLDDIELSAFRTGDLGKHADNDDILYLGRKDSQVKIAGNKINLLEIETAIKEVVKVEECIVRAVDNDCRIELVAFLKAQSFDKNYCKDRLKNKIPAYMVPNHFVVCETFPLLPNGKIDRGALIDIFYMPKAQKSSNDSPKCSLQLSLINIIETSFNISGIGINENFFELGITSLEVAKLSVTIKKNLGLKVSVAEIANYSTIQSLSTYLRTSQQNSINYKKLAVLPVYISPENKVNLFIFHPITGLAFPYLKLKELITGYNIYAISNPFFGQSKGFMSIKDMASYYTKILLETQSYNGFYLAGWSFGGTIALEVANQLIQQGYKVSDLIMIDTFNFHHTIDKANQISLEAELNNEMEWLENEQKVKLDTPEGIIFKDEITTNIKLLYNYIPRTLAKNLTLIKAAISEPIKYPASVDRYNGWSSIFQENITRYIIEGKHDELFRPGLIVEISNFLNTIMAKSMIDNEKISFTGSYA